MDLMPSIINAVAYAAITTKKRFATHSETIPGETKWISIVSVKQTFTIAITLQYSIN